VVLERALKAPSIPFLVLVTSAVCVCERERESYKEKERKEREKEREREREKRDARERRERETFSLRVCVKRHASPARAEETKPRFAKIDEKTTSRGRKRIFSNANKNNNKER